VVIISLGSVQNIYKLEQDFDLSMFISRDTFHYDFLMEKSRLYPNLGSESNVIMGGLNYSTEIAKILKLSETIENRTDILYDFKSWAKPFRVFVQMHFKKDIELEGLTDEEWSVYLSQFLYSSKGAAYNVNFKFQSQLECGQPAPRVKVSSVPTVLRFDHILKSPILF
jgi:Niemann-Pick C1 protein